MKIKIYIFYIHIIIYSIKLNNFVCRIVLPVETLTEDNYLIRNLSTHQKIIKKSISKKLYTILEIGTPIQKIPLFINVQELEFEITSLTISSNNPLKNNYIYNLSSIFNKYEFFNENKSSTFKSEGCIKNHEIFSDHLEDCFSSDNIFFYNDKNGKKEKYEHFNFNLVKKKEENITGVLGLGFFDISGDIDKSFMKLLKQKKIIDSYNWYFDFDTWNNSKGKLILGSLPHEDYPDIYSERDLFYTYIPLEFSSSNNLLKIEFDGIYTNPKNSSLSLNLFAKNAILNFDSDIIIGPKEFETKIKEKYLDYFLINKKCFTENFKESVDYINQLKFYYCNINLKEVLYENLPSIKFFSKDLNFTLEITKDKLYKIEGNYIYFLVLFDSGRQNNWYLGKPISLRYPFVFNCEIKKIGLYSKIKNNDIKKNTENKNYKFNKSILIFIVAILSIILVILGIIIGKIIYGINRKKRANELIDNYEYITEQSLNKDINENIKYNNKNNTKEYLNPSIEMKINS